jgi:hypothetical protein
MIKNIIVITSVIDDNSGVYSQQERYTQVENTIESVYKYIPDPYIILVEGSQKNHVFSNIHQMIHEPVGRDKSLGELTLLKSVFLTNVIQEIVKIHKIDTINKISGRYTFCFDFVFQENFLYKLRTNTWSGHGVCDTRYYRFPISYLSLFQEYLENISTIFIDIEHTFYKHGVLPIQDEYIERVLDIHGHYSPTGQYIRD